MTSTDTADPDKERRAGSRDLIHKITVERAEMLTLFCQVAGLDPFGNDKKHNNLESLLQKFCQVLVDYVAAGHFGLYQRIINGEERRSGVAELAGQLYPEIARTTRIALDFNDKYDSDHHCDFNREFERDLSRLGEDLATRIELEDRLMGSLL